MEAVVETAPGDIAEFLRTYYYTRFEVLNLKRILRGKFSGMASAQIADSLVPMAPFRTRSFQELAEAETLERAVEMLEGTPYALPPAAVGLYREQDVLWPLELALSHTYARAILRSVEGLPFWDRVLVRSIVEFETDVENVLTAVKQRRGAGEESAAHALEDLFPATYAIGFPKIREIVEAKDLEPVVSGLGPPYAEALAPLHEGDVALIRTRIRRHIYQTAKRGRSVNDFGFNVVMAYLVFCEVEKDDLVGIAWGKAEGVPSEDILKYLVVPPSA